MATKMPSNSEKSPFTPVQTPFMASPTRTIPNPIKIPEIQVHPLIIYAPILIVCFRMLNGISELLGILVAINGVSTGMAWVLNGINGVFTITMIIIHDVIHPFSKANH